MATTARWQMPPANSIRSRWVWATAAVLITTFALLSSTRPNLTSHYSVTVDRTHHRNDGLLENVQNSTLGFERIFAISLASRTDQHDQLALAGRLTGLDIDVLYGISGDDVSAKTVPNADPNPEKAMNGGTLGAWRAHMNTVQKIVKENIQTALILEGDVDWDIRFKQQMHQFAQASRILLQPQVGTNVSLDPTWPVPLKEDTPTEFHIDEDLSRVTPPQSSPYGDLENWDILWIGHCGTMFTEPKHEIALGRVVISDDETVPQTRWLDMQFGDKKFKTEYPNNTRVVHRAMGNVCTLGYAVTQKGAQKILYELGLKVVDGATDIMIRDLCGGHRGRPKLSCLSVTPQLMQHHRPKGLRSAFTDIGKQSQAYQEKAYTKNIRLSTKINLPQLVYGYTNYTEQWGDDEPGP